MLEALADGIFRIVIPFEELYTSVFVLVEGEKAAVVDSACGEHDVETYILPALRTLKKEVSYIVTTHSHSDHAGGRDALLKAFPKAACVQFFGGSPWGDGDQLLGRFRLLSMKGHTPDGLAIYDEKTKTLLSGDTLQQHGIGRYRDGISDRVAYRTDIMRVRDMELVLLIASHDYDPFGFLARGEKQIEAVLSDCEDSIT